MDGNGRPSIDNIKSPHSRASTYSSLRNLKPLGVFNSGHKGLPKEVFDPMGLGTGPDPPAPDHLETYGRLIDQNARHLAGRAAGASSHKRG